MFIFRSFPDRLSGLLGLIDEITFMQLDERLAGLLLSKGSVVKTTHSQLADELGSVREVISRILKDFEIKGLVKLDRNQVRNLRSRSSRKRKVIFDGPHGILYSDFPQLYGDPLLP